MNPMFADGGFEMISIAGREVEMLQKGSGRPLLYLHGGHGFASASPFLASLAGQHKIFAPSHPGFGATPTVDEFATVDDLGYHYLDMLDALDLNDVVVVGASFGGWIALDMAVKRSPRIGELILVGATGVKFNDREHAQFADPFLTDDPDLPARFFHSAEAGLAAFGNFEFKQMGAPASLRFARNAEAFMRFGWSPLLHDPAMRRRLHRIDKPTQLIWGAEDRVAPLDYARQLTAAIKGAQLHVITEAGHYVDVEKPDDTAQMISGRRKSGSILRGVA